MTIDRVRALKFEDPASGGSTTDFQPTEVNPQQDYLDALGVSLQRAGTNDEAVKISRSANDDMVFSTIANATVSLNALVTSFAAAFTSIGGDIQTTGSGSTATAQVLKVGNALASDVAAAAAFASTHFAAGEVLASDPTNGGLLAARRLVAADIPTLSPSQISSLAASATTDTTSADNILSGALALARISANTSQNGNYLSVVNGVAAWVPFTGGGISGSGTTNQLAYWTGSGSLGSSASFAVGGGTGIRFSVGHTTNTPSGSAGGIYTNALRLNDAGNTSFILSLQSQPTVSYTISLPPAPPTAAGQALTFNGSTYAWVAGGAATGNSTNVAFYDGSGNLSPGDQNLIYDGTYFFAPNFYSRGDVLVTGRLSACAFTTNSDYTVDSSQPDTNIAVQGSKTVTLPAANLSIGRQITVTNVGSGTVTVATSNGLVFQDGTTSKTLAPTQALMMSVNDNQTQWNITGSYGFSGSTGGITGLTGDVSVTGTSAGVATVQVNTVGSATAADIASAATLAAATYAAGFVAAAPASGSGKLTPRLLVASDIPTISGSQVSGLAASAYTDTTNAGNIASGTLNAARIAGQYTGITGVGTLTAGVIPISLLGVSGLTATDAGKVPTYLANGTVTWQAPSSTPSYPLQASAGTAAAPSYSFSGQAGTGLYLNSNALGIAVQGNEIIDVAAGLVQVFVTLKPNQLTANNYISAPQLYSTGPGTSLSPAFAVNNTSTGMYGSATQLSLSANNTNVFSATNALITLPLATVFGSTLALKGSSGSVTFAVPGTISSYTLTYPNAQGAAGNTLVNDGSGNLSWATVSGGGSSGPTFTPATSTAASISTNVRYTLTSGTATMTVATPTSAQSTVQFEAEGTAQITLNTSGQSAISVGSVQGTASATNLIIGQGTGGTGSTLVILTPKAGLNGWVAQVFGYVGVN